MRGLSYLEVGESSNTCQKCQNCQYKPFRASESNTKNKKKRKKKSQNKNKPTCGYEASNEIGENENESQNETFYDKHVVHIVPQSGW